MASARPSSRETSRPAANAASETRTAPIGMARLWRELDQDRRLAAADAFWRDADSTVEHAQAIDVIARRLNFRARSIAGLPVERRAKQLASVPALPDGLARRLLVVYHLATQRPMMSAFLDRVGIGHDDGLITDDPVRVPDGATLAAAARELVSRFPPNDVSLYLAALVAHDPETWGAIAGLPELSPPGIRPDA